MSYQKKNKKISEHVSKEKVTKPYLEASDDGGGEGGVVLRTEHRRVHQNEAHDAGEGEGGEEARRLPALKLHQTRPPVVEQEGDHQQGNDHEEGIVVQ